jgi:YHS domain-containing protein
MRLFTFFLVGVLLSTVTVMNAHAADGNVADRQYVCMMQDTLQVKPGVPVQFDGRTYYGCCPMCAQTMTAEPARYLKAKDPVTGETVDKASALIYGFQGSAFYFASDTSRQAFAAKPSQYTMQQCSITGSCSAGR